LSNIDTDVIIIGSGLGGLTSAILLGQLGIKATIIEKIPFPVGYCAVIRDRGLTVQLGFITSAPQARAKSFGSCLIYSA